MVRLVPFGSKEILAAKSGKPALTVMQQRSTVDRELHESLRISEESTRDTVPLEMPHDAIKLFSHRPVVLRFAVNLHRH